MQTTERGGKSKGVGFGLKWRNKQRKRDRQTGNKQRQRQSVTDRDGGEEAERGGRQRPGGSIIPE